MLFSAFKGPDRSRHFRGSRVLVGLICGLAVLSLGAGDAASQDAPGQLIKVAAKTKSRTAARVAPYDDKRRVQIYSTLNKEYLKLWDRGSGRVVATARTRTFNRFPHLRLEDRDGDGVADFYAYYPSSSGGQTMEFGAFFDIAGDGTPDWLVFYGGSIMAERKRMAWWNHHAIDRNNDGKFDTLVVDRIDMNGNGLIEPGTSVWIYDANFDGRIDLAEHVVKGKATRIQAVNGKFDTRMLSKNRTIRVGEPFGKMFDKIARDIAGAL